jgi:SAM-dependent methyltransferase
MNTRYTLDDGNVWRRSSHSEPFPYTDGRAFEDRLLRAVSGAGRVDTFAPELRDAIIDWPTEYHLSRSRHCLLRPLGIEPGDKVLELGCGCGALTRFLGEIGAEVVAIEGSAARSRIAAERCRGLRGVRIVCEDLLEFETVDLFDWVIMVGVIEYAPLYSADSKPVESYLKRAAHFLRPDGKMVVAVENQLGLKYFNGCSEDHLGIPFAGIEDLYSTRGAVTYGKRELERRLRSCGLVRQEWFYPFPDYKLPSVILGERAFETPSFNAADLLVRVKARDYGGQTVRFFEESLVHRTLERNGILPDMSNSFMVVAGKDSATFKPTANETIAWAFAVHRHEQFVTQTTFVREGAQILVLKSALGPTQPASENMPCTPPVLQRLESSIYRKGRLSIWRVVEAGARNASLDEMAAAFLPWCDELLSRAGTVSELGARCVGGHGRLADYCIDGALMDCTPFNLLECDDGPALIDQEWVWPQSVPVGRILCRGVLHSLALPLARAHTYEVQTIVERLCAMRGLAVDQADVAAWLTLEAEFLAAVGSPVPETSGHFASRSHLIAIYPELVRRIQEASRLQEELARTQRVHALDCAELQQRLAQSDTSRAQLEVDVRGRSERIEAMKHVLASQTAICATLMRDLSDAAEAVRAADKRANDAHRAAEIANDKQHHLAQEVITLRKSIESTLRESEAAQQARAAVEQSIHLLLASSSWRLTAPLRHFKESLRRLVRAMQRLEASRRARPAATVG